VGIDSDGKSAMQNLRSAALTLRTEHLSASRLRDGRVAIDAGLMRSQH
jgi:hypothetical protein